MFEAEQHAQNATQRSPFSINLVDLRDTVETILSQFGRFGFFNAYTVHSIKHIDEMINSLSWIIPADTKAIMSPADWFVTVSSIFLHDIGMIITKKEFDDREKSDFPQFVEQRLFSGDNGEDYQERINALPPGDRDKFLYEEFVRSNHGSRARAWIEGRASSDLGVTQDAADLVDRVLRSLDQTVRSDIAMVVESHNLDDIRNTAKYPIVRPYANTKEDTANIQYCALLLRTADLLQITSDRAPTKLFRLINPTNPVSQAEWIKQNGVRMVEGQKARNPEGNVDENLHKDTIDVYANFKGQKGYFGLNSFLDYADKQIIASFEIAEHSRQRDGAKHEFPWKRIHRKNIKADGYLQKEFRFELDQEKILNLLTGHTLYNDSLVVIRELAQNALDAVRLHRFLLQKAQHTSTPYVGKIRVRWDSKARILEVSDNGTGMSQDIIERHFLKVGSSKYQEPSFRKTHSDFVAISRFGIGVLSAFMVAEAVEVLTIEEGDSQAREISLESVHGHYLVRLRDKSESEVKELGAHGTRLRLSIRPSARTNGLLSALQQWVIIPGCEFSYEESGAEPIQIGFGTPAEAVKSFLPTLGYIVDGENPTAKVAEKKVNGISIAYALQWSDAFHEWSLLRHIEQPHYAGAISQQPARVCVHGVAVEFNTPGFRNTTIISVADVTGKEAPRTNVARTLLEENEQAENLSDVAYDVFVMAIKDEIDRLISNENMTLTRATNEAVYLAMPLGPDGSIAVRYPKKLKEKINNLSMFLMEGNANEQRRNNINLSDLKKIGSFWTVEGEVVRSAETLLAQFKSNMTINTAIRYISGGNADVPQPLLCNLSSLGRFQNTVFDQFQISRIEAKDSPRQIAFLWQAKEGGLLWKDLNENYDKFSQSISERRLRTAVQQTIRTRVRSTIFGARLFVATSKIETEGLDKFGAIRAYKSAFIMPSEPICNFLRDQPQDKENWAKLYIYSCLFVNIIRPTFTRGQQAALERNLRTKIQNIKNDIHTINFSDEDDFISAIINSNLTYYDPLLWASRTNALLGDSIENDDLM